MVDALQRQYGIIVLDSARHNETPVPRIDLTVRKFDLAEGPSVTGSSIALVAAGQAAVLKLARALGAAIEASSKGATPMCFNPSSS